MVSNFVTFLFSFFLKKRDGTWTERREYDGSEWWKYMKTPEIPEKLK